MFFAKHLLITDILAKHVNSGVASSVHASTESLVTTVAQAKTDMEANQRLQWTHFIIVSLLRNG